MGETLIVLLLPIIKDYYGVMISYCSGRDHSKSVKTRHKNQMALEQTKSTLFLNPEESKNAGTRTRLYSQIGLLGIS